MNAKCPHCGEDWPLPPSLTPMEVKILAVIADMRAAGANPSYEEIGFYVGSKSRGCICTHVLEMVKKGVIAKHASAASIRLTSVGMALLGAAPPAPPFRGAHSAEMVF